MKKKYSKPICEIIPIEQQDMILTSRPYEQPPIYEEERGSCSCGCIGDWIAYPGCYGCECCEHDNSDNHICR